MLVIKQTFTLRLIMKIIDYSDMLNLHAAINFTSIIFIYLKQFVRPYVRYHCIGYMGGRRHLYFRKENCCIYVESGATFG